MDDGAFGHALPHPCMSTYIEALELCVQFMFHVSLGGGGDITVRSNFSIFTPITTC